MIAKTRGPRRRGPAIAFVRQSPRWRALPRAAVMVRKALAAAAALCGPQAREGEVTMVLADDAAIRRLNRQWRGKDRATNVLSFPAPTLPGPAGAPRSLGDIVIAYECLTREAKAESKPPLAHLAHLAVHGFLHLLGYDHESEAEAEQMENLERRILRQLGLPDPYVERTARSEPRSAARRRGRRPAGPAGAAPAGH